MAATIAVGGVSSSWAIQPLLPSVSHCHIMSSFSLVPPSLLSLTTTTTTTTTTSKKKNKKMILSCGGGVALKPESSSSSSSLEESDEFKSKLELVGSKVTLKSPLKVYHVPKVPEFELAAGTEGVINNYVGFWKGKRISANYPYKIQFQIEIEGRGLVKVFVHLREDEFDII